MHEFTSQSYSLKAFLKPITSFNSKWGKKIKMKIKSAFENVTLYILLKGAKKKHIEIIRLFNPCSQWVFQ